MTLRRCWQCPERTMLPGLCGRCVLVRRMIRAAHAAGNDHDQPTHCPERARRVAEYARRAERKEPLFAGGAS